MIHPPQGSDPTTYPPALVNKRLFAFADSGAPDGIKVDTEGNVYGGCSDGVHVSTLSPFDIGPWHYLQL